MNPLIMYALPHMMLSLLLVLIIALTNNCCKALSASASTSCGNIGNISCPFYLRDQEHKCHNFSYALTCENNRTVIQVSYVDFYVEAINYVNSSVRIIDSGLARNNYSCSSTPYHHFFDSNRKKYDYGTFSPAGELNRPVTHIDCPAPVKNSSTQHIPTAPCLSSSVSSYVVIGHMNSSEVENDCTVRKTTWVSSAWPDINKTSFLDIHNMASYGIELRFNYLYCLTCDASPSRYCRAVRRENTGPYCSGMCSTSFNE